MHGEIGVAGWLHGWIDAWIDGRMHAWMHLWTSESHSDNGPVATAPIDSSGRKGQLTGENAWEGSHSDNKPAEMNGRGAMFH